MAHPPGPEQSEPGRASPAESGRAKNPITATVFSDPACPFGYSANPVLRTLEWRYRDQITWDLVTIGLSDPENPSPYGPAEQAAGWIEFRERYGMPFAAEPKARSFTTARACQTIASARLSHPGSEWRVFRTFQLLHFNTPLLLDDDDHLAEALATVPGIDAAAVAARVDSTEVRAAYLTDHSLARRAGRGPAWLQGRTADSPQGPRYTAPSVIFSREGRRCEIGGFQPIEAYDVVIANLDPGLNRLDPAEDPLDALRLYPAGLTTSEVASLQSPGSEAPDRGRTERELVRLVGSGRVRRVPLGSDALWLTS